MNPNTIGFRVDSVAQQEQIDEFTGLGRVKRRLSKVEEKVGLGKTATPTVNGSTDSDKLDSLISALAVLGIIKDETV